MKFHEGQVITYKRVFTKEEVKDFIALSKYTGRHHEIPNEDGELLIQGLLTAMLPTKIGGENDILIYKMDYNFVKPVYTGEEITCAITVDKLFEKNDSHRIDMSIDTKNPKGHSVLTGVLRGVLLDFNE